MSSKQEASGGTHDGDLRGPRDMAKARLLEPQSPVTTAGVPRFTVLTYGATDIRRRGRERPEPGGRREEAKRLRKQIQAMPSRDPQDPNYRRLRYIRYADDWLLGFCGPRSEAEEIKA